VGAGSVLNIVVMDKTSAGEMMGLGKLVSLTGVKTDRKLGTLRLQVGRRWGCAAPGGARGAGGGEEGARGRWRLPSRGAGELIGAGAAF
jgi:hypothetical protein